MMYGQWPSMAVLSSRKNNELLVFEQQISMMCEYAALFCMPAFFVAARLTFDNVGPNASALVSNCVAQVAMAVRSAGSAD